MLQRLADHISNCLDQAADAERRAAEASNEAVRVDNEKMAQSWRQLARSYQFAESLDRFLLDVDKRKGARQPDPPTERKAAVFPPPGATVGSATFVNLVMEAAAIESLREEAAGIEQEMQRFLSEVKHATDKGACRSVFIERFMELLKRRGATARKTVILFEKSRDRSVLGWLAGSFRGSSARGSST